jgi:trigger factor
MPKIDRHDIDDLNISFTVTLEKNEIKNKYNSELNRLRQRASIKGFRQGKVPEMVLRKMYGDNLYSEVLNSLSGNAVADFIEENKFNILGQPIPSEDSPKNNFNPNKLEDIVLKFDIGLSPAFEIKGMEKTATYTKHYPETPQDWVDGAFDSERRRHGKSEAVTTAIKDNDMVKIAMKEVGGDKEATPSFLVKSDILTEDAYDLFLKFKTGDKFQINVFEIEKNLTRAQILSNYFAIDDESTAINEMFDCTIEEVTRIEDAELNEEFFQKAYGEGITNEAEARAYILNVYKKHFEADAFGLLIRDLRDTLIEKNNDMPLPDEFLKRWLMYINPKNTKELVEADYPNFSTNLRWDLVRSKIEEEYNVHVHDEDIKQVFKDRAAQVYGGQFEESLLEMLADMMMKEAQKKDKKQFEDAKETAFSMKFFQTVANNVTIEEKIVPMEEFQKIREAAIAKMNKETASASTISTNIDESEYEEVVAETV